MKISKKMETAINRQVNAEFYSAYLYLSMAAYFEQASLRGAAAWMRVQAQEELGHGMRLFNYVLERGGSADLKPIEKPPAKWKSPLGAFEASLEHEQKVTKMIDSLCNLAKSEKDHATEIALQWFVTEQIEEEASVGEIVEKLKLVGSKGNGLFMIDKELGKRKK